MTKEKQTRTYDEEGFRRRAACLCVRSPNENEILLVTSSRATDHWIVPGGGVEPNEDPSEAAIRETEEEAGVKGVIKRCLGDFENEERKHRTSVFVMEVHEELDEWEDSKSRTRRWFPVEEAYKLLQTYKPVQCTYVRLMIKTSGALAHLVPLVSGEEGAPCNANSSAAHYLQVNHYPNSSRSHQGTTGVPVHTFISSRNVYSTDSETTEDSPNVTDHSSSYVNDLNRANDNRVVANNSSVVNADTTATSDLAFANSSNVNS